MESKRHALGSREIHRHILWSKFRCSLPTQGAPEHHPICFPGTLQGNLNNCWLVEQKKLCVVFITENHRWWSGCNPELDVLPPQHPQCCSSALHQRQLLLQICLASQSLLNTLVSRFFKANDPVMQDSPGSLEIFKNKSPVSAQN